MRTSLIYPPLLDPTAPYHSLSYVKAAAVRHGYRDTRIVDAGIGAVRHVLAPGFVASTLAERRARRRHLLAALSEQGLQGLDPADARELAELHKLELIDEGELPASIGVLTDPTEFYNIRSYRWAVDRIVAWMSVLGTLGIAGQFSQGFRLATGGWSPSRITDLTDQVLVARISRPFDPYFGEVLLPDLGARRPDVIGLNVTFTGQLPFALRLLGMVRSALPEVHLVIGGTEVSQLYKYLTDEPAFFAIFRDADTAIVGEGESAFVSLLDHLSGVEGAVPTASVRFNPTGRGRRRSRGHPAVPPVVPLSLHSENLRNIPAPMFDDIEFDRYLSPHRYVYVSPTRGCYWNRCAFCDYGLNGDTPTSPWRQQPIEQAFDELRQVAQVAPFVYLSVDVAAPAMLHRLATRVRESALDICWGAEVRLERYWTPDKCRDLRAGGCVAVSVGFESACRRILDAMDKGTEIEHMRRTIENLADAGIAVQIMAFTGFPTETYGEAMETLSFLEDIRELWTLGDVGDFVLTAGSSVAKDPARYGLTRTWPKPGHDIRRTLGFTDPARLTDTEKAALDRRKRALRVGDLDRPWLGGVDTPHSYFYHARFGRDVGRLLRHDLSPRRLDDSAGWHLNGRLVRPPDGTELSLAGRALTLRRSDSGRLFVFRRDGTVFLCPDDLAAAIGGRHRFDLGPRVDLNLLSEPTKRALLANRLIFPLAGK